MKKKNPFIPLGIFFGGVFFLGTIIVYGLGGKPDASELRGGGFNKGYSQLTVIRGNEKNPQQTEFYGCLLFPDDNSDIKILRKNDRYTLIAIHDSKCENRGMNTDPVNVFLIKFADKTILVDAGNLGGFLMRHLETLEINPADISAVLITHIHPDNVGGLVHLVDDEYVPNFPNAEIFISPIEYGAYRDLSNKYVYEPIKPFLKPYNEKIKPLKWGKPLFDDIMPLEAAGHSHGHTIFAFDDLLFIGDLYFSPFSERTVFMRLPGIVDSIYKYFSMASEGDITILSPHVPFPGAMKMQKDTPFK